MAESPYPYSRQAAKQRGELARWKRSHQANVKCARDIKNLIVSHTQDGQLEADCARAALDWWGFPRVQLVLSNTLRGASGQGFDPDALHWAQTAQVPYEKATGEFKLQADSALLAQFLRQTYGEYQALGMFGPGHCVEADPDYAGKVLVLRPDRLREECWSAQNQVWLGEGGFAGAPTRAQRSGSRGERRSKGANAVFAAGGNEVERTLRRRGRAVFATCLGDGEEARWNREDFMGVLDGQYLPDWAMGRLAQLRGPSQEQGEPVQEQAEGPAQGGMEMG